MKSFIGVAMVALSLSACTKESNGDYDVNKKTEVVLEFDNIAGDQQLILNNGSYANVSGEQFTVSLLQYFISNTRLQKTDGTEFIVPQDDSYFLIQEHNPNTRLCSIQIPEGEYTTIAFTLGVDSVRSAQPISERTGVLDPANYPDGHDGMYWSWNSGYIFLKMEGESPAAPADPGGAKKYRFHIGGFGGYSSPTINNIRETTIDLREKGSLQVKADRKPVVHFTMDVLKIMNGATNISIAANPTVMFGAFSSEIANNYSGAFAHVHTHN
jgi:hypothetical protein